jgi:hypothetical protein
LPDDHGNTRKPYKLDGVGLAGRSSSTLSRLVNQLSNERVADVASDEKSFSLVVAFQAPEKITTLISGLLNQTDLF